jgi:ATP-dependent Lon protease
VHHDVAMTGEITLRGKVLAVGGLPEKTVAALRLGMRKVVLPKANEKDLPDLPVDVRKGMELVFVDHVDALLEHVLERLPSPRPKSEPAPVRPRRSGRPAARPAS